ncbi:hypothetical protein [Beggiatoa alba]|uniref:hypothetical protein n=1 Tax=Beggiatoa alba TaxID=1022 RepID=UPI0018DEDC1D|nr:hypothetical protein [Beggiatoa alba]
MQKNPLIQHYLKRSFLQLIMLSVCGLCLSACSQSSRYAWQPVSQDTQIVWADDDSELLIGTLRFEQRQSLDPLMGTTNKQNFSHQLSTINPDGSNRRIITVARPYQLGKLYYMKRAGYILAESILDNGLRQFHRITEQGKSALLVEIYPTTKDACPNHEIMLEPTVIPSPDGQYIAYASLSHCQQISVLFYTSTRDRFADQQTLVVPTGVYSVTWRKDGAFIIANTNTQTAWQLLPQTPVVNTNIPRCLTPVTTSSHIAIDGREASFIETGIHISAVGTRTAFGCQ